MMFYALPVHSGTSSLLLMPVCSSAPVNFVVLHYLVIGPLFFLYILNFALALALIVPVNVAAPASLAAPISKHSG